MALSAQPQETEPDSRRIVIVMGPGRSGTSTIAGSLAKAGFEVPGHSIRGNPTNPSGFFEPRWVVNFHKAILDRTDVGTLDSSPGALDLVSAATANPRLRAEIQTWLSERLETQPRLVIKDPRSVWFRDLWVDTARGLGVEPGFVTMLRHPAEVSASRQKYYSKTDRVTARFADIQRIAGWINVALNTELITQGSPRVFVRYADLVADWRRELSRVGESLDLTFTPGLDVAEHPVDEFIDPALHRVQVDWDDVEVPEALRDLGERVWTALSALADADASVDPSPVEELRHDYAELHQDAMALSRPVMRRAEVTARRRVRRQMRAELSRRAKRAPATASRAATVKAAAGSRVRKVRRKMSGRTP
ncbi:MAG: sulfotransferase family protein [Nocardioides sp.]